MIDLRAGPAATAALCSTGDATARKRDIWSALERAHLRWPSLLPPPTPRAAGRTMEAVGAVKLDLETWKKNSAVDLHVLNRCLCRRSGGGEYLLKSTQLPTKINDGWRCNLQSQALTKIQCGSFVGEKTAACVRERGCHRTSVPRQASHLSQSVHGRRCKHCH